MNGKSATSSRKKAFIRGAAVDFGGAIILMVASLAITPIVLSYLDASSYGFWMTIQQIVGMLGLLEMGAAIAVTQRVANPELANDRDKLSRFMSASSIVQLGTAFFIVIIGLGLQAPLFNWFKIDEAVALGSNTAYRLMVFWFAVSTVIGLLPALLAGRQKMAVSHGVNFLVLFITNVGVIPFLALGMSIVAFPLAQCLGGLLGLACSLYYVRKYAPSFRIRLSLVDRENVRSVFGVSFYNWIAKIAFIILTASDNIIIAATLGAATVTPYLLTSRLAGLIAPNMARFSSSAMAGFSELYATKNYERLQAATLGLFKLSTRTACLGAIIVILCTEKLVKLWVGSQYFVSTAFVVILGILCFRDTIIKGVGIIIIASGDMRGFGILTMVEAVLKVVLVVFLIKALKLGLTGVVLGQLLATVLISGVYFPKKILMLTKLPGIKLLYDGFLNILFKSAPTMVVMYAMSIMIPESWKWVGLGLTLFSGVATNIAFFDLPIILETKGLPLPQRIRAAYSSYLA